MNSVARQHRFLFSLLLLSHVTLVTVALWAVGRPQPALRQAVRGHQPAFAALATLASEALSASCAAPGQPLAPAVRRAIDQLVRALPAHLAATADLERALRNEPPNCVELRAALKRALSSAQASMISQERRGLRKAQSGGWVVVLLGLAGAALVVGVAHRYRRRFVDPLHEVDEAARAIAARDPMRRAHVSSGTPAEFQRIATVLNELADRIH